jgi:hypothetical protein
MSVMGAATAARVYTDTCCYSPVNVTSNRFDQRFDYRSAWFGGIAHLESAGMRRERSFHEQRPPQQIQQQEWPLRTAGLPHQMQRLSAHASASGLASGMMRGSPAPCWRTRLPVAKARVDVGAACVKPTDDTAISGWSPNAVPQSCAPAQYSARAC